MRLFNLLTLQARGSELAHFWKRWHRKSDFRWLWNKKKTKQNKKLLNKPAIFPYYLTLELAVTVLSFTFSFPNTDQNSTILFCRDNKKMVSNLLRKGALFSRCHANIVSYHDNSATIIATKKNMNVEKRRTSFCFSFHHERTFKILCGR